MDEARYREVLPAAFVLAMIERGGKPDPVAVGLWAREITKLDQSGSIAFAIAIATAIPAEIVKVERIYSQTGADWFRISYRSGTSRAIEEMESPAINDSALGHAAERIWGSVGANGESVWIGARMVLFRRGDSAHAGGGRRVCVYAVPTGCEA